MSLAYSLPGIIRALNQSCGACDLGAFESPLKPLGRQPANGSTVASPDPRDVSGLVSAGSPPTVAAALELRSGGAWLDSDHLLNAIQLPRFEVLANRPADALGPLVFGPVVFGPLAFGPWHLAPDWSAAVPRMSLTWPMETWSPAAEAGRWPAPVAPGATYQSNDRGTRATPEPHGGAVWIDTLRAYGQVVARTDLERHFPAIEATGGQPGVISGAAPDGDATGDSRDALTGLPMDTNTRFTIDPDAVAGEALLGDAGSARATLIHDSPPSAAGAGTLGMNGVIALDTFRAIASYTFGTSVTPSLQYFHTAGSANAVRFVWPGARQNNSGLVAGVAFDPWPEPGSPVRFLNLRVAAQYVAHTEGSGASRGTTNNNALVLSLWGALRF